MKAFGYRKSLPIEHPEVLLAFDLPKPTPGPHDLLVEVKAIAINPVDAKFRKRSEPAEGAVQVLGWDCAGVVRAVGAAVNLFAVGDEVYYAGAVDRPGANSEFHVVDERIVGHKPKNLSFAQAAALPLTSVTAWELLFDRLEIPRLPAQREGVILIIGAAGGVGSIMIQLLKKLTALKVIGTASRPTTQAWIEDLGVDHVIDHSQSIAVGLEALGINEVDYVASLTQSDLHFEAVAKVIKPQGRYALIDDPAHLPIALLKRKSISIHWEFMFTRSLFKCEDMLEQHHILSKVSHLIEQGELQTTLGEHLGTINVENLKKGHALIESGKAKGKLVLEGF